MAAEHGDFEKLYSQLREIRGDDPVVREIDDIIFQYFVAIQLPDEPTLYDLLFGHSAAQTKSNSPSAAASCFSDFCRHERGKFGFNFTEPAVGMADPLLDLRHTCHFAVLAAGAREAAQFRLVAAALSS
jgi:hypothetical protein